MGGVFAGYDAADSGGQLLMVVPKLDLAVPFTGGHDNNDPVRRGLRDEILAKDILAAVTSR